MSRPASVILLILLLAYISSAPLPASAVSEYRWVRSTTMFVAAVASEREGRQGVLAELRASVGYPGDGEVYISVDPLSYLDTQAAARIAVLVAAFLAGVDPFAYDYYISIKSDSIIIGGPSAGAAMAIAILAALRGDPVSKDVVVTGMINPDGTIGPVGGLYEKLLAVAERGLKTFVIPAGQRVVTVKVTEAEEGEGPNAIVVRTRVTKVDLVEEGRRLGVNVVEAASVREAYAYFTGKRLSDGYRAHVTLGDEYVKSLMGWYREFEKLAKGYLRSSAAKVSKLPPEVRDYVTSFMDGAEGELQEARMLSREGFAYAAASKAFAAAVTARYTLHVVEYVLSEDPSPLVRLWERDVNLTLSEAGAVLKRPVKTIEDLEKYIAAKLRYDDALKAYERFKSLAGRNFMFDSGTEWGALHWLAYAKLRAVSAIYWYNISAHAGPPLDGRVLEGVVRTLLNYAESVTGYVDSLYGELGLGDGLRSKVVESYLAAARMYSEGDRYSALAYSLNAIAYGTLAVHAQFQANLSRIHQVVRDEAISAAARLKGAGVEPFMILSYLEFGYLRSDPLEKLYFYEMASSYGKVLVLLAGGHQERAATAAAAEQASSPQHQANRDREEIPAGARAATPSGSSGAIYAMFLATGFAAGVMLGLAIAGVTRKRGT